MSRWFRGVESYALEARHLREVFAKVADVVERLEYDVHETSVPEIPQADDLLLFGYLRASTLSRWPIVPAGAVQRMQPLPCRSRP